MPFVSSPTPETLFVYLTRNKVFGIKPWATRDSSMSGLRAVMRRRARFAEITLSATSVSSNRNETSSESFVYVRRLYWPSILSLPLSIVVVVAAIKIIVLTERGVPTQSLGFNLFSNVNEPASKREFRGNESNNQLSFILSTLSLSRVSVTIGEKWKVLNLTVWCDKSSSIRERKQSVWKESRDELRNHAISQENLLAISQLGITPTTQFQDSERYEPLSGEAHDSPKISFG